MSSYLPFKSKVNLFFTFVLTNNWKCAGTAYLHGLKHASGDFVVIMDADLSHHVRNSSVFLLSDIWHALSWCFLPFWLTLFFPTLNSRSTCQASLGKHLIFEDVFKSIRNILCKNSLL